MTKTKVMSDNLKKNVWLIKILTIPTIQSSNQIMLYLNHGIKNISHSYTKKELLCCDSWSTHIKMCNISFISIHNPNQGKSWKMLPFHPYYQHWTGKIMQVYQLKQNLSKIMNIFINGKMFYYFCYQLLLLCGLNWILHIFCRVSVHRVYMRCAAEYNNILFYFKCNHISIDLFQPKTDLFPTRSLVWVHFKTVRYFYQPIFGSFLYLQNALHNLDIELCSTQLFSKIIYSYILPSRTFL